MDPISIRRPLPEVDQARLKPALRERPRLIPKPQPDPRDAVERALDLIDKHAAA